MNENIKYLPKGNIESPPLQTESLKSIYYGMKMEKKKSKLSFKNT